MRTGEQAKKNCRANQIHWNQNEFFLFVLRKNAKAADTSAHSLLVVLSFRAFPALRDAYNATMCTSHVVIYLFIYLFFYFSSLMFVFRPVVVHFICC